MFTPGFIVCGLALLAALRFEPAPDPLRPHGALAQWVVTSGVRYSPTIARLVDGLATRDVIVYVMTTAEYRRHAAETRLVYGAGRVRYLLVTLSERENPQKLLELLAHELQHVHEIADRRDVRDEAGLRRLFGEIGEERAPGSFETRTALRIEGRARLELQRYPRWLLGMLAPRTAAVSGR